MGFRLTRDATARTGRGLVLCRGARAAGGCGWTGARDAEALLRCGCWAQAAFAGAEALSRFGSWVQAALHGVDWVPRLLYRDIFTATWMWIGYLVVCVGCILTVEG